MARAAYNFVMRPFVSAILVLASSCVPLCAQDRSLVITNVNVIDVVSGGIRPNQDLVIVGDRIAQVGAASEVRLPVGAKPIAGDGYYLIPGLWDMHIHLRNDPTKPDISLAKENAAILKLFLMNGVVGVREMGGDLAESVLEWRQEIEAGKREGPRIVTAGRKLDGEKPHWPGSISVMTPDEGRQAVLQVKRLGADFVKIYFMDVDPAVLRAIVEEAHKQQMKVTGHAPSNIPADELVNIGVDGLEHVPFLDGGGGPFVTASGTQLDAFLKEEEARSKTPLHMGFAESSSRLMWMNDDAAATELYKKMARKDFFLTPTVTVMTKHIEVTEKDFSLDARKRFLFPTIWMSWDLKTGVRHPIPADILPVYKELFKRGGDSLRAAHKAGVSILAGTDSGVANSYLLPGWSLHEELENLVKNGFTPLEALQAATLNAAKWRGRIESEGVIEKNKVADLVMLRANPLESIGRSRDIEAVIARGRYYSRADLDHLLAGVEEECASAWAQQK
jgi:imidazolonepropionase-like amidohydrolase